MLLWNSVPFFCKNKRRVTFRDRAVNMSVNTLEPLLSNQIVVAVVAHKWAAGVACAVSSSGVGAGAAHQVPISLGKQCGRKNTCRIKKKLFTQLFDTKIFRNPHHHTQLIITRSAGNLNFLLPSCLTY